MLVTVCKILQDCYCINSYVNALMLDYSNVDELNKHLLEIQTHDEALLEILEE